MTLATTNALDSSSAEPHQHSKPATSVVVVAPPAPPPEQEQAPQRDEDALAIQPVQRPARVRGQRPGTADWLREVFAAQRQLAPHIASTQAGVVAFLLHHSLRSALAAQRRLLLLEAPPGHNGAAAGAAAHASGAPGGTAAARAHLLRGLPPLPPPPGSATPGSHSRGISPAGSGSLPASGTALPLEQPPDLQHAPLRHDPYLLGGELGVQLLSVASTNVPTVTISPVVSPRAALQPHTSAPLTAAAYTDTTQPAASTQGLPGANDAALFIGSGAGAGSSSADIRQRTAPPGGRGSGSSHGSLHGRSHRSEANLGGAGNGHHATAAAAAEVLEALVPQCVRMGVSTSVGLRSSMEDFAFAMPLACPGNVPGLAFRHGACFGVFDGHGGHEVAQSLAQHVPEQIQGAIHHIATEGPHQMGEILMDHERRLKRDPGIWSPSSSTSSLPAAANTAASTPSGPHGRPPAAQSPSVSFSSAAGAAAAAVGLAPSSSFGKRSSGGPAVSSSSRLGAGALGSMHVGGAGLLSASQLRAATASPMGGGAGGGVGMRRLHTSALSLHALHREASGGSGGGNGAAVGPEFGFATTTTHAHGVTIEELPPSEAGGSFGGGSSSSGVAGGMVVVTSPAAVGGSSMSCPSGAAHVSVLDAPLGSSGADAGLNATGGAALAGGSSQATGGVVNAANGGTTSVLPPLGGGSSGGCGVSMRQHVSSSISGGQHSGAAAGPVPPHVQALPPHVRSQSDIGLAAWDNGASAAPHPAAVAPSAGTALSSWALQQQQQQQQLQQAAAKLRGVQSDSGGGQDASSTPQPVPVPHFCPPIVLPEGPHGSPQQQPIVTSPTTASAAAAAAFPVAAEAPPSRRAASPVIVDVTTPQPRQGARRQLPHGGASPLLDGRDSDGGVVETHSLASAAGAGQRAAFEVLEPPEEEYAAQGPQQQPQHEQLRDAAGQDVGYVPSPAEVIVEDVVEGILAGEGEEEEEEGEDMEEVEDQGLGDWESAMHGRDPGSTALVATVIDRCMFVANVGDCRLIVAERDERTGQVVPRAVTNDHVPSNKDEAARLAALQVPVSDDGYVGPGAGLLAVCRSIGDFSTKEQLGEKVILSEPELHTYMLTRHSLFAVASSDGITCALKDEEIVNQVCRFLHEPGPTKQGNDPKHAAEQLVRYAIDARNSPDNASAVVVLFTMDKPPLPTRPRRFGLGAAATVVAAVVDLAQNP